MTRYKTLYTGLDFRYNPSMPGESVAIMMEKTVTITLWSRRKGEEPVTLTAAGTLENRDGGVWVLRYQGENAQHSTITVEPERVTVDQRGEIGYQMVFEAGQRHSGQYETPYGAMEMTVVTHDLEHSMGDKSELSIVYHLIMGGMETERTRLRLTAQGSHTKEKTRKEENAL